MLREQPSPEGLADTASETVIVPEDPVSWAMVIVEEIVEPPGPDALLGLLLSEKSTT